MRADEARALLRQRDEDLAKSNAERGVIYDKFNEATSAIQNSREYICGDGWALHVSRRAAVEIDASASLLLRDPAGRHVPIEHVPDDVLRAVLRVRETVRQWLAGERDDVPSVLDL